MRKFLTKLDQLIERSSILSDKSIMSVLNKHSKTDWEFMTEFTDDWTKDEMLAGANEFLAKYGSNYRAVFVTEHLEGGSFIWTFKHI